MSQNQESGRVTIIVALIGLIGVIGAALINSKFGKENIGNTDHSNPINSTVIDKDITKKDDDIKYEIEKAIINYFDTIEEAHSEGNTEILSETADGYDLDRRIEMINRNNNSNSFYDYKYRNVRVLDYEINSNKSKADVEVTATFKSTFYIDDSCSKYIPTTNLLLYLTLEKFDNDWKVTRYKSNVSIRNLAKNCS